MSSEPQEGRQVLIGMLLVSLSAFGFSLMHATIRHVSTELHAFQIAFFRNAFGFLVLSPLYLRRGLRGLRTPRFGWHLVRGVLQVGAMTMFFYALTIAPLARVSALGFTSPLFATLGAVVLLGETLRMRRLVALVLGFVGAWVILRPGLVAVDTGSLLVLGSSVVWALAMLIIKYLSRSESAIVLTAWMGIVMTPISLVPALWFWRWPSVPMLLWSIVIGVLGAVAQLAMAEAFRRADASAVMPFDFTRLLWASVLGFVLFAEVPEVWTWLGGGLIFGSTTYIAIRESRLARVEAASARTARSAA